MVRIRVGGQGPGFVGDQWARARMRVRVQVSDEGAGERPESTSSTAKPREVKYCMDGLKPLEVALVGPPCAFTSSGGADSDETHSALAGG